MTFRNHISDAKTCKEFGGNWKQKQKKCDITPIKSGIQNSRDVDAALENANARIKGFGVESTRGKPWVSHYFQDINLLYVNKGDTYAPTIIYDTLKDIWYIGCSWGDIIESDEKRFDI